MPKWKLGERVYARPSPEVRIDAIIAREFEEDLLSSHEAVLKRGGNTVPPVTDEARRILRTMGS